MTRTELLQEIRRMRFVEAYVGWQTRRLTQGEAARLLGCAIGRVGGTWTALLCPPEWGMSGMRVRCCGFSAALAVLGELVQTKGGSRRRPRLVSFSKHAAGSNAGGVFDMCVWRSTLARRGRRQQSVI